jgi:hypothetical protein
MHCVQPYTATEGKKFRLAEFFDQNWDAYVKSPKEFIHPEQFKAVYAMRRCRTEALGVDHYVCTECGEASYVYHSCKNRFCPTCSWKDTMDWGDNVEGHLLHIPHRHVVFTLPHGLNWLTKRNRGQMLNILFQVSAEIIKEWMWHKYKLVPGIVSVLHTFGETKEWHTHIHMILSWGGTDANYQVKQIKGVYVNYKLIQDKFRCKFGDRLIGLFDSGALDHGFSNRAGFMQFVKRINKNKWHIQFGPALEMPPEVVRYIGRYSKRACISEHKITNIEGGYITFKHKDNKHLDYYGKPIIKELSLHYNEFFPRLLQHVPLPYFRLVRYYGAYAARTKAILKKLYPPTTATGNGQGGEDPQAAEGESYEMPENPKYCKNCNVEKTYMYTVFKDKEGNRVFMSRFSPKKKGDKPDRCAA